MNARAERTSRSSRPGSIHKNQSHLRGPTWPSACVLPLSLQTMFIHRPHHRVSSSPAVCELARAHAAGTLQWATASIGLDHETRRRVPALFAHSWRSRRAAHCTTPGRCAEALNGTATVGRTPCGPDGPQQNDHRRRQQTGPHHLGGLGTRHHLHGHSGGRVDATIRSSEGAAQRANEQSLPDRSDRHWTRPITRVVFKTALQ